MDLGLRGKVAIVLGASKGMGRASARALAQEGCSLSLAARDIDVLTKAAFDLTAECSVKISSFKCDVTQDADRERFLADTLHQFGRVDILVNNCGGPKPGTLKDAPSAEDWQDAF